MVKVMVKVLHPIDHPILLISHATRAVPIYNSGEDALCWKHEPAFCCQL